MTQLLQDHPKKQEPRLHSIPQNEAHRGFDAFRILRDFVSPTYFTVGLVSAFIACCLYGFQATTYNVFRNFHRFHQFISPDSLFYPTISQLRSLALSKVKPDQILVIVGGNSIFNGVGQPESQLWTEKLQQLLGPQYAVVNFAFRGAFPFEAGYVCAESLLRDHPKLLYATITAPGMCGSSDEGKTYGYFYWDAESQGLLRDYPARKNSIVKRLKGLPEKERTIVEEQILRYKLNPQLRFCDGWQNIGYRRFFTVWNVLTAEQFTKPRRRFTDPEGEPAADVIKRFGNIEIEKNICRSFSARYFQPRNGDWEAIESEWQTLESQLSCVMPTEMRERCLVVFPRNCSFYRRLLSKEEQLRDDRMYAEAVRRWKKHGFTALDVGNDFNLEDYCDRTHFATKGGAKLAEQLSASIKTMASSRGYLQ